MFFMFCFSVSVEGELCEDGLEPVGSGEGFVLA